jgi:hypothetical protein
LLFPLLITYFSKLKFHQIILWSYLVWYFAIVGIYFDPALRLWLSSLGLSGIIGFALLLATKQGNVKQDSWVRYRLFIFPFCVSSYSALIKGEGFFLIFPTNISHFAIASTAVGTFLFTLKLLKFTSQTTQN